MSKLISSFAIIFFISFNNFAQDDLVKSYYPNDTLKSEINYSNKVREGAAKFYYPNGKIQQELNFVNGKVDGVVKNYYDNGNLKEMYSIEDGKRNGAVSLFDKDGKYLKDITYEDGKFVSEEIPAIDTTHNIAAKNESNKGDKKVTGEKINQLKKETGEVPAPPVLKEDKNENPDYLLSAEVIPEPVGGMNTIMKKLIYPESAKEDKIQGTVRIRALIDEYGEVTQDEVVQGIGHGCDEAAKIAVYYTKFTPGLIKGKPVKVQVIIPVEFKLDKK
ncbi:MAG: TonB family protein [Bacteroidetes bacterium]|nr:TonB family protein [Bacteroidota bacterium]